MSGTSLARAPGFSIIAHSAVAVAHTGDTDETALATIGIPAGAMGPNGLLRVTASLALSPSSANAKTVRGRLGGLAGTVFGSIAFTTNTVALIQFIIANRNDEAAQHAFSFGNRTTDLVMAAIAGTTGTVDTTAAQNLVISGQLASAGESITLENYLVELLTG